jgi:hypothetical protein
MREPTLQKPRKIGALRKDRPYKLCGMPSLECKCKPKG